MFACMCVFKMYPAMISGYHEGESVCALKMYPAMISGDHEGKSF